MFIKKIESKEEIINWIKENITTITSGWYSLTDKKAKEFTNKIDLDEIQTNNTIFELFAYDKEYSYAVHFYGDFYTAKKISLQEIKHCEKRVYLSDFGKIELTQMYELKNEDGVEVLKPTHLLYTGKGA